MTSKNTFNKKERLLQLPTKCSCNNLQKCFAISYKKVLQKTHYGFLLASTEEILLRELKVTVLTELNKVKKVLERKYKLKYRKNGNQVSR